MCDLTNPEGVFSSLNTHQIAHSAFWGNAPRVWVAAVVVISKGAGKQISALLWTTSACDYFLRALGRRRWRVKKAESIGRFGPEHASASVAWLGWFGSSGCYCPTENRTFGTPT